MTHGSDLDKDSSILDLLKFGAGYVTSEELIELGGAKHLDVAWLARDLRSRKAATAKALPAMLIPVRADGFGNYDCIDTLEANCDVNGLPMLSNIVMDGHLVGFPRRT